MLKHGFFGQPSQTQGSIDSDKIQYNNYSWSGQRRVPPYLNKLIFPEDFLTGLRTIAMQDNELLQVSSLLEEVCFFSFIFQSFIAVYLILLFDQLFQIVIAYCDTHSNAVFVRISDGVAKDVGRKGPMHHAKAFVTPTLLH